MLVLTTMFVSVSNELPKTSYMKMVDYWLVFNLFVPFAEVLLHVCMVSGITWSCLETNLKGCNEGGQPQRRNKENQCGIYRQQKGSSFLTNWREIVAFFVSLSHSFDVLSLFLAVSGPSLVLKLALLVIYLGLNLTFF